MGRSRTMRGVSHSVDGYPGWRPAKRLQFDRHQTRTKSLHTFCMPRRTPRHTSPVSVLDLVGDGGGGGGEKHPAGRSSKNKERSNRSSSNTNHRHQRRCERTNRLSAASMAGASPPAEVLHSAEAELEALGIAQEYCVEVNSSGGLSYIPRARKVEVERQRDQDFVSRMHELIFAQDSAPAPGSRCIESFCEPSFVTEASSSSSSAVLSPLLEEGKHQESLERSCEYDSTITGTTMEEHDDGGDASGASCLDVTSDVATLPAFRMTYVHIKSKLTAEFGRDRFRRFQADVQHLMCERERQHSRSVSLSTGHGSSLQAVAAAAAAATAAATRHSHSLTGDTTGHQQELDRPRQQRQHHPYVADDSWDNSEEDGDIVGFADAHQHSRHHRYRQQQQQQQQQEEEQEQLHACLLYTSPSPRDRG